MTYAPTTNAPTRNANVEAYINPDPNPNPNPDPNPYPALNQKPNHTHESNSVFGEVSMPEQLSPEHNVVSPLFKPILALHIINFSSCRKYLGGGASPPPPCIDASAWAPMASPFSYEGLFF